MTKYTKHTAVDIFPQQSASVCARSQLSPLSTSPSADQRRRSRTRSRPRSQKVRRRWVCRRPRPVAHRRGGAATHVGLYGCRHHCHRFRRFCGAEAALPKPRQVLPELPHVPPFRVDHADLHARLAFPRKAADAGPDLLLPGKPDGHDTPLASR